MFDYDNVPESDGSIVQSTYCAHREFEFSSQHVHMQLIFKINPFFKLEILGNTNPDDKS